MGMTHYCMLVKFIDDLFWMPRHVIIGLFEAADTTGVTLAESVKGLLKSFGLTNKILAYVKDEGANLNTLVVTLCFVVSCKPLQFDQ